MVLSYYDRSEIVYLTNDYGFLINWNDIEPPEFYLYDKIESRIERKTDFSAFLSGLRGFPDGAGVEWITKCTVPFSYAMPSAERKLLDDLVKVKGFRFTDATGGDLITVCTCESTKLTLLKDGDEIEQVMKNLQPRRHLP